MPGPSFGAAFAVREFRALWGSVALSACGDRLALVALTVLIYDRTRSPLLAAIAYAAGYLPWLAGGLFLSDLVDRRPRRTVMVSCDAARAMLVAAMALPGVPLGALVALLYVATMLAPPFESARAAITPDILPGKLYQLGASVIQTTFLTAEVAGAGAGGVTVAFLGARPALVIDAATFAASGLLVAVFTRRRPAPAGPGNGQEQPLARAAAGIRLVFGDQGLRTLTLFGWLAAFYAIPQSVAVTYAASLGGGPAATGLVLASTAVATLIGTPLFARLVRQRSQLALMGPLATATCATLVLTAFRPGLAVSLVIFSASSAFGIYQITANVAFVNRVPPERRAQAFGIAGAGVVVVQGAAFVAAGAAAEVFSPAAVIAAAGMIGTATALLLTIQWRRLSPPGGRHAARGGRHGRGVEEAAASRRERPAGDIARRSP